MAFVVRASVNEARDSKKGLSLHELVKLKQIDVMMVQETHSDDFKRNRLEERMGRRSHSEPPE